MTESQSVPLPFPAVVGAPAPVATLAVVLPTFNERDNVEKVAGVIATALAGEAYEIVFVDDDSTDGTRDVVAGLARRDGRIRLIHRIGRRGLSSAVVEGVLSTSAPFVAVMDADLQHDERLLPAMLATLRAGEADVVIGSRYVADGGLGDWDKSRADLSRFGTRLAQVVTKTALSDPLSGFFMITRTAFDQSVRGLSAQGYKILVDLLASAPKPLRAREIGYTFRQRVAGDSKLDSLVAWEYAMLLLDKSVGRIVPVRFVMFAAIGGLGVLVHMAVLTGLYQGAQIGFAAAQGGATFAAMTFNFFANNQLTYRDKRLKGVVGVARGLATFYAVCSIGAVANVGIADFLFGRGDTSWWLAGLAGIAVGAVWNYAASAVFTWKK